MAHLDLTTGDVAEIRRLLTLDGTDYADRSRRCLLILTRLIPCDAAGFGIGDREGYVEFAVSLPEGDEEVGIQVCDGPWTVGVEQLAGLPACDPERVWMTSLGIRDTLRVGFGLGGGRVAQVYLDRRRTFFEPRHVAVLSMLEPALGRLLRPPDRPARLATLSDAERRVLDLVALGGSNQDVAERLSVTEATVRKHLEHAYRKLGVSNRTAAAALVHVAPARVSYADPLIPT